MEETILRYHPPPVFYLRDLRDMYHCCWFFLLCYLTTTKGDVRKDVQYGMSGMSGKEWGIWMIILSLQTNLLVLCLFMHLTILDKKNYHNVNHDSPQNILRITIKEEKKEQTDKIYKQTNKQTVVHWDYLSHWYINSMDDMD